MSTTHKKRKLVPAANPTANDFRLRPNHRCYPPSYPNLPGTANAGTPSAYLPVRLVPAHDGDNNNLRTATPVTAGTELLFLNGILLQTGDDYDPHAQPGQTIDIIKIHCDIDHLDVVTLLAPAATGTNPGQADQPSPYLTQPLPLNQIRYTLRGETTSYQHTNKDSAIIGPSSQPLTIHSFGQTDNYHYLEFDGVLMALDGSVFYNYQSLHTMRLPDSVDRIGNSCFQLSSLQRLDAGKGLRSLGYSVFKDAAELRELLLPSEYQIPHLPNLGVFAGVHPEFRVKVPESMIGKYFTDDNWSQLNIEPLD